MKQILCVLLAVFGTGCTLTSQQVKERDDTTLCMSYHMVRQPAIRDELTARGSVPEDEWADIDKGVIRIGMSEIGMLCAWGPPGAWGGVNRTRVGNYSSKQYVFRACRSCRARYVYVSNRRVTAIQN